jgi:hypothetical protein
MSKRVEEEKKVDEDESGALKTALMQTQLRMVEMGRSHRFEIRNLTRQNHELTQRLLRGKEELKLLRTSTDFVPCSERDITNTLRNQFNRLVENNKSYISRHELLSKQIEELERENARLSSLLKQVTSKSAEAVYQYRGLHEMLIEKVQSEKNLKSEVEQLQKCQENYNAILEKEQKEHEEKETIKNSLRVAEIDILSSRATLAMQETKVRELTHKLKQEQHKSSVMARELEELRRSAPEDIQNLVDQRDRLEKEIDDTRDVLGVLKAGSLHSAIKRLNRVSILKQNRMKKTIESLTSENNRLVKIEFEAQKLRRERDVLVEYVNRLEGKLGGVLKVSSDS